MALINIKIIIINGISRSDATINLRGYKHCHNNLKHYFCLFDDWYVEDIDRGFLTFIY
jgi:hypothetical protein